MKQTYYSNETDGFYGVYYEEPQEVKQAMILMLGDSSDDYMAKSASRWLLKQGIAVMAMSPTAKDYGHHNLPLERFGKAIAVLQEKEIERIGIIGASTTGMLALLAASYYPEITLTIAISPSDFVMEGFYQDGLDGARERPGEGESTVSWQGKPLPYLPFAYRHPQYWQKIQEESKRTHNLIASREMFDESEKRNPLREEQRIPVEKIHGHIVFVGAEDDVLWDTVKYCKRMMQRLQEKEHVCQYEALLYRYGTHFLFPQSMLKQMIPFGSHLVVSAAFASGRKNRKECLKARIDLDCQIRRILQDWKEGRIGWNA